MTPNETHDEKMTRIVTELGTALRTQAAGTWRRVRTAERAEPRGHAWKFRPEPDSDMRFLRVSHEAMDQGDDPVPTLLKQLTAGKWLSRLDGTETSLVLNAGGKLGRFKQK